MEYKARFHTTWVSPDVCLEKKIVQRVSLQKKSCTGKLDGKKFAQTKKIAFPNIFLIVYLLENFTDNIMYNVKHHLYLIVTWNVTINKILMAP